MSATFEDYQAVERVVGWAKESLTDADPLRADIETMASLIPDDAYKPNL